MAPGDGKVLLLAEEENQFLWATDGTAVGTSPLSSTLVKLSNGELLFCVVGDDVYHIGDLILQKNVYCYIVPKRLYDFRIAPNSTINADELFDSRFYSITNENIFEIMRKDRRLFKIVRKI